MFCIPLGLAKVYPPHPKIAPQITQPQNMQKKKSQRPNKLNFPFTSLAGEPALCHSALAHGPSFWEECKKCERQMRRDFTHNLAFFLLGRCLLNGTSVKAKKQFNPPTAIRRWFITRKIQPSTSILQSRTFCLLTKKKPPESKALPGANY